VAKAEVKRAAAMSAEEKETILPPNRLISAKLD